IQKPLIDCLPIGRLIVEPPEIEAAHSVSVEGFRQLNATLEQLVLLFECEIGIELIAFGAVLRSRSIRPIHLKEWAGNVGHAKFVPLQNTSRFLDLFGIELR